MEPNRRAESKLRRKVDSERDRLRKEEKKVQKANKITEKSGLNVTKLPKVPNLKEALIPKGTPMHNWSDLLKHPFTAPSEGVYCPINSNLVPCPSSKVRNYGAVDVIVGTNFDSVGFWFWPEGTLTENGLSSFDMSGLGGSANQMGPILSGADPSQLASAGVMVQLNSNAAYQMTTVPPSATQVGTSGTALTLPWDSLINPFAVPAKPNDVKFRCTAFGVRISYTGRLEKTEGYVDFYNPYHWVGNPQQPIQVNGIRRDPSHRRKYFGNQRTVTFVWHPNCESSSFARINRGNVYPQESFVSRFMMRIGGVETTETTTDKFIVEYIGFQEYTGHPAISTDTPAPISKDAIHIANAIPMMRGGMNPGGDGPTTTLAHHVAAQKVSQLHPAVASPKPSTVLPAIAKGATTALGIAKDVLPLLSFI